MNKNFTIKDVREGIDRGEFSAKELFEHYTKKIGHRNDDYRVYLSVFGFQDNNPEKWQNRFGAKAMAAPPLYGVPSAIKDNMLIDGTITTAASKILANYIASYDATAIKKLKSAGVEFLGKTNMDEFAMGTSTENSAFGPTRNPLDVSRVPGGSSGGSAAAVAADLCVFALGSDTGGSIRQPASFCGIVGLKPTYGRVSRHGLIAMASSFDQIGPLTKNVYDAALVLNTLVGKDVFDSTTVDRPAEDFTTNLDKNIKGMRIGVPKEFFLSGLDGEVREKIQESISTLQKLGCETMEISLPNFQYALACYYILVPSEVSANLAKFDGIRYGYSAKADNLVDTYFKSRSEGLGPESKRRIMIGTYALSSGYYDAYYLKAQKVRALIKKDFDDAFKKVDVIVGPTTPSPAFKIEEKANDPVALYLEDIYTVPINLAGIPAISIPCGFASNKMPIGFQIIAKQFDEGRLLNIANILEQSLK